MDGLQSAHLFARGKRALFNLNELDQPLHNTHARIPALELHQRACNRQFSFLSRAAASRAKLAKLIRAHTSTLQVSLSAPPMMVNRPVRPAG